MRLPVPAMNCQGPDGAGAAVGEVREPALDHREVDGVLRQALSPQDLAVAVHVLVGAAEPASRSGRGPAPSGRTGCTPAPPRSPRAGCRTPPGGGAGRGRSPAAARCAPGPPRGRGRCRGRARRAAAAGGATRARGGRRTSPPPPRAASGSRSVAFSSASLIASISADCASISSSIFSSSPASATGDGSARSGSGSGRPVAASAEGAGTASGSSIGASTPAGSAAASSDAAAGDRRRGERGLRARGGRSSACGVGGRVGLGDDGHVTGTRAAWEQMPHPPAVPRTGDAPPRWACARRNGRLTGNGLAGRAIPVFRERALPCYSFVAPRGLPPCRSGPTPSPAASSSPRWRESRTAPSAPSAARWARPSPTRRW